MVDEVGTGIETGPGNAVHAKKNHEVNMHDPWTQENHDDFHQAHMIVTQIRSTTTLQREKYTTTQIEELYKELETYQPLFRKAMSGWAANDQNVLMDQSAFYELRQLIKASVVHRKDIPIADSQLEFAVSLLGDHISQVQDLFLSSDDTGSFQAEDALEGLSLYVGYGKDIVKRQKALEYLSDNFSHIRHYFLSDDNRLIKEPYAGVILQIYKESSPSEKLQAQSLIAHDLYSIKGSNLVYMVQKNSDYNVPMHDLLPDFLNVVAEEIRSYGVNPEKIINQWTENDEMTKDQIDDVEARRDRSVISTLKTLRELDEMHPHCAQILQQYFGINHFGRYPVEILKKQYKERDDISKPYVIILGAADDHNEVTANNADAYKGLLEQIGDKCSIRITECDSKYGANGIGRKLMEFRKAYNPDNHGHKIGGLILAGHGNKEGSLLLFGAPDNQFDKILTSDFGKSNVQSVRDFFVDNPDVVVASCNGGKQIAQALSTGLHARTFAHTITINRLEKIDATVEGDKISMIPEFAEISYDPDVTGETVVYINGAKQ